MLKQFANLRQLQLLARARKFPQISQMNIRKFSITNPVKGEGV